MEGSASAVEPWLGATTAPARRCAFTDRDPIGVFPPQWEYGNPFLSLVVGGRGTIFQAASPSTHAVHVEPQAVVTMWR